MLENNLQPANAAGYSHDHALYEGIIPTLSGKAVDLYDPKPEMIDMSDIANALSLTCRFNGQVSKFCSIAQSACLLTAMVPDHLKKLALLYYMPVAYLGEVSEPLKIILGDRYNNRYNELLRVVALKFNIDVPSTGWKELEEYVKFVTSLDRQWLQLGRHILGSVPTPYLCHAWSSDTAFREFTGLCMQYFNS